MLTLTLPYVTWMQRDWHIKEIVFWKKADWISLPHTSRVNLCLLSLVSKYFVNPCAKFTYFCFHYFDLYFRKWCVSSHWKLFQPLLCSKHGSSECWKTELCRHKLLHSSGRGANRHLQHALQWNTTPCEAKLASFFFPFYVSLQSMWRKLENVWWTWYVCMYGLGRDFHTWKVNSKIL